MPFSLYAHIHSCQVTLAAGVVLSTLTLILNIHYLFLHPLHFPSCVSSLRDSADIATVNDCTHISFDQL